MNINKKSMQCLKCPTKIDHGKAQPTVKLL